MLARWRRKRLLARPFPRPWEDAIRFHVATYRRLSEPERARLRDLVRIFVAEKHWEGCGGLVVDDLVKVVVAAQACILVLELGIDAFAGVEVIIVYPRRFAPVERWRRNGPIVQERTRRISGEAWLHGPVVLAWDAVLAGAHNDCDGDNVVYHELAHKLDMATGTADGVPPLRDVRTRRRWTAVFDHELAWLREQRERGESTFLDPYAAESRAELFAVATEHFFEQPERFERHHGELYWLLAEFYRQDPVLRVRRRADPSSHERTVRFRAALRDPPRMSEILRNAWLEFVDPLDLRICGALTLLVFASFVLGMVCGSPHTERLLPPPTDEVSASTQR